MTDKQQEYDTYVKLGRNGLIERTPSDARELAQLKGTGWIRKGSKNEPSAESIREAEQKAEAKSAAVASRISPTSAAAAAAHVEEVNALPEGAEPVEDEKPVAKSRGASKSEAKAEPVSA